MKRKLMLFQSVSNNVVYCWNGEQALSVTASELIPIGNTIIEVENSLFESAYDSGLGAFWIRNERFIILSRTETKQ